MKEQADEQLRLAVQVGGIGVFESNLDRRRTRFSPELCTMLGLPVGTQMTYEEASRLIDGAAFNPLDDGQWSGPID